MMPFTRPQRKAAAILIATAIAGGFSLAGAPAQEPAASALGEPAGQAAYQAHCASCHGETLTGGFAAPLKGARFAAKWRPQGYKALHDYIVATMPPGQQGQLDQATYAQVSALVAAANDIPVDSRQAAAEARPPSAVQVPAGSAPPGNAMGGRIVRPSAPNEDAFAKAAMAGQRSRLGALRPVTDAMLRSPPPGDWINWRRTYDASGSTPLIAINRDNVTALAGAWSLSLAPGANQISPLVHDGILFVASGNQVVAVDAASGDLLWTYVRTGAPAGGTRNQPRSIAIHGHSLFVPTIDGHMLALDVRSGELLWDRVIASPESGVQLVAGPLVVKGKVIQGAAGCATEKLPGGCFLVALDAETGREAWRFHTIARPSQRGGASWNGAPLDARFGGGIWTTASYDAATNLVYIGTGQTYKTATLRLPRAAPGPGNAALHTDSTLALDPETGRLAWAYQHLERDIWDMDWGFERTLLDLDVRGRKRRLVVTIGKLGIIDALDARTGAYVFSRDLGLQNLVTAIDPKTGYKTTDPRLEPAANGPGVAICPSSFGVRNWPASAYAAETGTLFLPMYESCNDLFWNPGTAWDISWQVAPMPGSDGNFGRVQAIDLRTGETLWTRRQRAPQSSAILATAGGLIFEGSRDRWFRALDARTGQPLWQTRLSAPPSAFPISYEAAGEQYVAVVAGGGGPLDGGNQSFTPEIRNPSGAPVLFVFKLGGAKPAG